MLDTSVYPGRFFVWVLAFFLIGTLSCTDEQAPVSGGSGSDTPNSLAVMIDNATLVCRADSGSLVSILAADYNPCSDSGFRETAVLDEYEYIRFSNLKNGRYAVLAAIGSDLSAYISTITISEEMNRDTIYRQFQTEGEITGMVVDSLGNGIVDLPVYLRGSPYCDTTTSEGRFQLTGIAHGSFELRSRPSVVMEPKKGKLDTLEVRHPIVLSDSQLDVGTITYR